MNDIIPNTTDNHLFDISDVVKHNTIPDLQGVVVYQLMYGEEFIPSYGVQWDNYTNINHESQDVLTKL